MGSEKNEIIFASHAGYVMIYLRLRKIILNKGERTMAVKKKKAAKKKTAKKKTAKKKTTKKKKTAKRK